MFQLKYKQMSSIFKSSIIHVQVRCDYSVNNFLWPMFGPLYRFSTMPFQIASLNQEVSVKTSVNRHTQ